MLEFVVDLQPEEYRRAMLWHQFAASLGKRINDWISWSVLLLTPLTVVLLLWRAPDALSIWFWPVAIVAVLYSLYSTVLVRYQIRRQADAILSERPALRHTRYQVHEKGIKLISQTEDQTFKLFLPWTEIERVRELPLLYLFFVAEQELLIVPKRSLPDEATLRDLLQKASKIET